MRIPHRLVQRVCVWFGFKLGMNSKQICVEMKRIFGAHAYSDSSVYGWCAAFRNGRTKLGDLCRPGAPQRARTRRRFCQVRVLLDENCSVSIDRLSESMGISVGSTHRLLHKDLHLKKRCAKMIPHVLTERQRMLRRRFCQDFLRRCRQQHFLKWVITTDEAWFYIREPGNRAETREWISATDNCPQVVMKNRYCKKMMVVPFIDWRGLVDIHYFENKTVNQRKFEPMVREVWSVLRIRRRPQWQQQHRIHCHMDNAPAHRADSVQRALEEMEWRQLPHPPTPLTCRPVTFPLPLPQAQTEGQGIPKLGLVASFP